MDELVSIRLSSELEVNSNAEIFYKDFWKSGEKVKKRRNELSENILRKYFPEGIKNNKVLEIGIGGEGGIVNPIKEFNEVYGVDVSDSAIELCKKLEIDVRKVNLNIDTIPFPDNYFDVVFAFEVFEHFANPQHAIEEIVRTLKGDGVLLISTPNSLTYHWPRLFYPKLFEAKQFVNFLTINNFIVKYDADIFTVNAYRNTIIDSSQIGWSNYFYCKKIRENDSESFFNNGLYFWNQRDENGIRLYPIEAIECFRKSLTINNNFFIRCFFTRALTYRGIFNDVDEFNYNINILTNLAESEKSDITIFVKFSIIMVEIELKKFQLSVLSSKKFEEYLVSIINSGENNLIIEINEELKLVKKLYKLEN